MFLDEFFDLVSCQLGFLVDSGVRGAVFIQTQSCQVSHFVKFHEIIIDIFVYDPVRNIYSIVTPRWDFSNYRYFCQQLIDLTDNLH